MSLTYEGRAEMAAFTPFRSAWPAAWKVVESVAAQDWVDN